MIGYFLIRTGDRGRILTALVESGPTLDVLTLTEVGAGVGGVLTAADTQGVELKVVDGY